MPEFLGIVARAQGLSDAEEWAPAGEMWAQVVDRNPVNGDYWARLAQARFAGEDYAAAIEAYEQVLRLGARVSLELMPGEVAYRIACCHARLGKRAEAIDALSVALGKGLRDLDRVLADECWAGIPVRDQLGIPDVEGLSRDDGWRADLAFLAREIKRRAYAPFQVQSETDFDRVVADLDRDIPGLADTQIVVGMMKLVRHLDDGHARVTPPPRLSALLPLDMFLFPEGLYVIAAGPGHEQLLGARVTQIGSHVVDDVCAALDPVLARDNDQEVKVRTPAILRRTAILHGLGLIPDVGTATLTVRFADGTTGDVMVDAVPGELLWNRYPAGWAVFTESLPTPLPLHLRSRDMPYWFEYLPAEELVYFQYNEVGDHPAETFAAFCDRLFAFVEDRRARLVIDIRWNGGGDTYISQALLHRLVGSPRLARRGMLFVIIGRLTFSAAQNTVTAIDRELNAIFVGEPTGSRPNFIGETVPFELPYSKVVANVSDLYWQTSWPEDHRTWIAPDIYAPVTFESFSRNEDPAMAAILAHRDHFPGG
jgi:hypothetical protein